MFETGVAGRRWSAGAHLRKSPALRPLITQALTSPDCLLSPGKSNKQRTLSSCWSARDLGLSTAGRVGRWQAFRGRYHRMRDELPQEERGRCAVGEAPGACLRSTGEEAGSGSWSLLAWLVLICSPGDERTSLRLGSRGLMSAKFPGPQPQPSSAKRPLASI